MKFNKYFVAIAIGILTMLIVVIFTDRIKNNYERQYSLVEEHYIENGKIEFEEENINKPIFDNITGKFFLPLRDIIEEMGGKVEWNSEKSTLVVNLKNTVVEIREGQNDASINGYSIYIEDAPRNINGYIYVSSDFIANNFGAIVEWDEQNKLLIIRTEVNKTPIINVNKFRYEDVDMAYDVEIPVIVGLNDKKYEENINNSFVVKAMEEIKIFATQSKLDEDTTTIYKWNEKILLKEKSPKIISFVSEGFKDELGGFVTPVKKSITINLDTQSLMKLSDLFKNDNYKSYISQDINDMWISNPEKYPISISEDISTVIEDNFYIKDGHTLVIFIKNKDGKTYSEFNIPFNNLKKYIKSEMIYLTKEIPNNLVELN